MNNTLKKMIKTAIAEKIQNIRRLANEYALIGDGKNETVCYKMVDNIRTMLYHNGFEVVPFAGGIHRVCGISIEIKSHRNAKWDSVVENLDLPFNI